MHQAKGAHSPQGRIDWIDHAKGICIVLVVMLYAVETIGSAAGREGWLHPIAAFAQPFRMPDFFLISGLLLSRVIHRPWRLYLDRMSETPNAKRMPKGSIPTMPM